MSWFEYFKRQARLTAPSSQEPDDGQIAAPDIEYSTVGVLGRWLAAVLLFPLQVLFLPLRLLGLFHQTGVDVDYLQETEKAEKTGFGHRLSKACRFVLYLPYLIVTSPIRLVQGLSQSTPREMLFVLPAALAIVFLGFVAYMVIGRGEVIRNRYARGIQVAMANKNYKLAKTYYHRLMAEQELSQPQLLSYMFVLSETGEPEKAQEILDQLAPDDNLGFGPAHRFKALQIARKLGTAADDGRLLKKLGVHLSRTDDQSLEVLEARATYYQKLGEHDKALDALRKAATVRPGYLVTIADYEGSLKRLDEREQTLLDAAAAFREILREDPLDNPARITLARIQMMQKRSQQAEATLLNGLDKQPDARLQTAIADFYVARHIQARNTNEDIGLQLDYLLKAIQFSPNYPMTYQQMTVFYMTLGEDAEERDAVRRRLEELITRDQPSPLAHFALSNVLWVEGKQAKAEFHLEQARKLAPGFVDVLNNLAWMMASREDGDLDRALELVNEALRASPGNCKYLDTRGTILLKQKRYKEAITDLERALANVNDPQETHRRLGEAYTAIDMKEVAKHHFQKSRAK